MNKKDFAKLGDPSAFTLHDYMEMEKRAKRLADKTRRTEMSNIPPVDDDHEDDFSDISDETKEAIEVVAKKSFNVAMVYKIRFDMFQKVGFDKSEAFKILLAEISGKK